MSRPPFEANYYALLGLDAKVPPTQNSPEILKAIAALEKTNPDASSGSQADKVAVKIGQGLLKVMRQDLAEDGAPVWKQHQTAFKEISRALQKDKASGIAKVVKIIGESTISQTARQNLAKDLGDDALLEKALKKAKITVLQAEKPESPPRKMYNAFKKAQAAVPKLAPVLHIEGAKDIWDLLSRFSGRSLGPSSTAADLVSATDMIKKNANNAELGRELQASFALLRQLTDPMLTGHDPKDRYAPLTLFHELWLLETGMSLSLVLSAFGASEQVFREQFDRAVAEMARVAKVDAAHAEHLLLCFFEKSNISVRRFAHARPTLIQACPFCGEFSTGNSDKCPSCSQLRLVPCVNCGTKLDATIGKCAACGVTVTDASEGQLHLKNVDIALAEGNYAAAAKSLKEVGSALQGLDISAQLKKVENLRLESASALTNLQDLVAAQKMNAAADALTKAAETIQKEDLARFAGVIGAARAEAEKCLKTAKRELATDAFGAAAKAAHAALDHVADHPGAQDVLNSIPPEPVKDVSAVVRDGKVALTWKPAPGQLNDVTYEVRRHTGTIDARSDVVFSDRATSYTDTSCPDGVPLVYSVWSKRAKATSKTAGSFGPVTVFRPVGGVLISPLLGEVRLNWDLPKGASYAEVRRVSESDAGTPKSQIKPIARAATGWVDKDQGLIGERSYSIQACYDRDGQVGRGPAVTNTVTPQPAPTHPGSFQKSRDDRYLVWPNAPKADETDVVLCYDPTARLPASNLVVQMNDLPDPKVSQTAITRKNDKNALAISTLPSGPHVVLVARKRGDLLRLSGKLTVDYTPPLRPVKNLRAFVKDGFAMAEWDWPEGATSAGVSCKASLHDAGGQTRTLSDTTVTAVKGKRGRFSTDRRLTLSCDLTISVRPQARNLSDGPSVDTQTRFVQPFKIKAGLRSEATMMRLRITTYLELVLEPGVPHWPGMTVKFCPKGGLKSQAETLREVKPKRATDRTVAIELSKALKDKTGRLFIDLSEQDAERYRIAPKFLKVE